MADQNDESSIQNKAAKIVYVGPFTQICNSKTIIVIVILVVVVMLQRGFESFNETERNADKLHFITRKYLSRFNTYLFVGGK